MTVYKNGTLKLENLTSTPANHSDKFYVLNNEPYYGNTKMQSSQLENITEGGNTGWRLLGRNPGNYGNIGEDAVDLSENINVSATTGATGDNSLASGSQTTAFGFYSTAMGFRTTALGPAATAIGWETTASGNYSTAMGQSTEASSWNSTSMGQSTEASGVSSTSMGFQTLARAYASLSLGRYNDSIAGSNPTTWVEADPLFIIGNGTSTNNRKNAVTILKNAKTGINTSTPEAGLHIKGIDASWNSHIRLETAGGGDYGNILYDGNMKFRNFGAGDEYQWRNSAGNTRMTLFDNGDLTIAGTLTTGSDARLKKDIKPIHNALAIISGINGYTYQWVDESRGSLLQSGVIAQEIEASLPHLVRTDEDDEKSVNYIGMVPYLIEAVKDLKKENEELKKLVEKLLGDSK
ncbi:MAG: tail fiber domain-containing protein [Saprospiraceae bacterium]|nr:tail fiber domain-containing protein [Saprospiraceae bacterium]